VDYKGVFNFRYFLLHGRKMIESDLFKSLIIIRATLESRSRHRDGRLGGTGTELKEHAA